MGSPSTVSNAVLIWHAPPDTLSQNGADLILGTADMESPKKSMIKLTQLKKGYAPYVVQTSQGGITLPCMLITTIAQAEFADCFATIVICC